MARTSELVTFDLIFIKVGLMCLYSFSLAIQFHWIKMT